jgi:hypothetical protein
MYIASDSKFAWLMISGLRKPHGLWLYGEKFIITVGNTSLWLGCRKNIPEPFFLELQTGK